MLACQQCRAGGYQCNGASTDACILALDFTLLSLMLVIEQAVVQVLCLCRNYVLCASGGVGGSAPGGGRHHLGQVGLVLGAWVPNATATNAAKS